MARSGNIRLYLNIPELKRHCFMGFPGLARSLLSFKTNDEKDFTYSFKYGCGYLPGKRIVHHTTYAGCQDSIDPGSGKFNPGDAGLYAGARRTPIYDGRKL